VDDYDPAWVSAMKAVPTVVLLGPIVALLASRGLPIWPTPRRLGAIVAGGLAAQIGGNVAFQWALGEVGVALTVPLSLGGMIVGAAFLGRVFLHEPVTPRAAAALGCLLAAIGVLSLGADEASRSVADVAVAPGRVVLGVLAACGSGLAYATLNVILRYQVTRGASLPTTLFLISVTGLLSLTSLAWLRIGFGGIAATAPWDLATMLAAGLCNTVAFIALTKSLQLTNVVYVNALNATQATLAALAGVLIFGEALSPWLALGTGLTIGGLMLLARAHRAIVEPSP
jgi:drug/metabolite transporter (DMT)-like permease